MTSGDRLALFLVSAAVLLLEFYWLRAFAESEWGHLASMVVSTAMLGIGAGGTLILLLGDRGAPMAPALRPRLLAAFLALAGVSPFLVWSLPLEPLLLVWRLSAWGWVFAREAIVAAAFAAGAAVVTLAFVTDCARPGRVYAINLLGSAAGVAIAVALMTFRPTADLHLAALFAGTLAFVASLARAPGAAVIALALGTAGSLVTYGWSEPVLAPTKDLSGALRLPEARVLEERAGLPGRFTVVASPALHVAPGLSLVRSAPIPAERAVFVQGDGLAVLFDGDATDALRNRVAWLPHALRRPARVLALGDAALLDLQAAVLAGADRIVAAVPDSRLRRSLKGDLGRFGGIAAEVEVRAEAPRAALARSVASGDRFDLVVIPPEDSLTSASAGLVATVESYTLTVEGIQAALAATTPSGQVSIQRWTQAPPRDLPKLAATATRALRAFGVVEPRSHLALVRSWDAWTLCMTRTPYSPAEREALGAFADAHGFDVFLPVPRPGEFLHQLPGPPLGPLLDGILASGGRVPRDYPYDLEPATDRRPFFHHFLSWGRVAPYLRQLRDGTAPPSSWGDFFLWASLLSAITLGGAFIAAPALALGGPRRVLRRSLAETLLFACLGFGYMFLEILFLQQGARLFGIPGVSAAVVLLAFLVGSGFGALAASLLGERGPAGPVAAAGAVAAASAAALFLEPLLEWGTLLPWTLRWSVLFLPAVLLAFPLGMPFPSGIARAAARVPNAVPWLVATNGWASVVGAVAASILATWQGFPSVGFAAALLYGVAALLLHRAGRRD